MRFLYFIFLVFFLTINCFSQKKVLTFDDYYKWKTIQNRQISDNGNLVSYELDFQKGKGNVILYNDLSNKIDTFKNANNAKFSPNSDFLVFRIKPTVEVVRKAKLAKTKKEKMPKDSVGVYWVNADSISVFPALKSFKTAKEKSSWLALYIEHPIALKDSARKDSTTADSIKAIAPKKNVKNKDAGQLVLLHPELKSSFSWDNVTEYTMSKFGSSIAFITNSGDSTKRSVVQLFNTISKKLDTIYSDTCTVKSLSLDASGNQLAFLISKDTTETKNYSLYLTQRTNKGKTLMVDSLYQNMPVRYTVSEHGKLLFSDDDKKLFFGVSPISKIEKNDSILKEEIPHLDLWSYTDIDIQPMQLNNLKEEMKKNYLALLRLESMKLILVEDSVCYNSRLINKNNGEFALVFTDRPYAREASWTGEYYKDFYRVNLKTGERELIVKGENRVSLNPEGTMAFWYSSQDSNYHSFDFKTRQTRNISKGIQFSLFEELHDTPSAPESYGVAGWDFNKQSVWVYDRYDIWKLDLFGKNSPENITKGYGRKNMTRLRYIQLDDELVYLPEKEILLDGFQEETMENGYFNLSYGNDIKSLVYGKFKIGSVEKSKFANKVIWSKSTLSEYPEIRFSGMDFKNEKLLSNTNPQQKEYNWAKVEMVEWTSFNGDKLKGLLYKPENFNKDSVYPMMVYYYERNSENIYRYSYPYPSYSTINKVLYCSNGYLVFVPDIVYREGYPGQSAYDAIVSGVNSLLERNSYINKNKIGLQGQSWGGYQTAYLVTQTNMFAAGMAGAPVSNMTSAYGGIRWESGMSRMFQYEHTQSRIGGTLWDKPMQYVENSPLFYVPKINTPLLIMSNDNDGAVPWYQGIELFMAMRRCNKPAWLINYNGMPHNLTDEAWANRVDLSKRMMQFFNHYLKDEPAPQWMIKGIPAIEKGKKLGY